MPIYRWFTHWKWWFFIVMLVYQRVNCNPLQTLGDFQKLLKISQDKICPTESSTSSLPLWEVWLVCRRGSYPKMVSVQIFSFPQVVETLLDVFPILLVSLFVLSIFPGRWFQTFFLVHFIYGMSSETHWRTPSFFEMVKLHHQPDSDLSNSYGLNFDLPASTHEKRWWNRTTNQFPLPRKVLFLLSPYGISKGDQVEIGGALEPWNGSNFMTFHIIIGNGKSCQLTFTPWFFRGVDIYHQPNLCIFHFIYGISSFPLTNSIIFEDGYCTTNQ